MGIGGISVWQLIIIFLYTAIPTYLLASEKGYRAWIWTAACLVPVVNLSVMCYFVGAPNARLQRKLEQLF